MKCGKSAALKDGRPCLLRNAAGDDTEDVLLILTKPMKKRTSFF